MVNELELAVHGTSCNYNAKKENGGHKPTGRGYCGVPSLYFAYVESELSDPMRSGEIELSASYWIGAVRYPDVAGLCT